MSASISRRKWINNDGKFLRGIAQQIVEDASINCLTLEDKSVLKSTSESVDTWTGSSTSEAPPAAQVNGAAQDVSTQSDEIDAITSLFRSRYLVYENSIYTDLFSDTPDTTNVLVSPYQIHKQAAAMDDEAARLSQAAASKIRAEDDDYDEDEDDEEDEEDEGKAPPTSHLPELAAHSISRTQTPVTDRSRPNGITRAGERSTQHNRKVEAAMEDRKNENSILRFEIDSFYHTLEYDRHALLEQNTLEASDRQVEEESDPHEKEKLSAVNFGAANLSLKHLISKIDESREKLAMSDNELRSLLSEVRKNRSKWANEDKVGQEELYEAAEKVVLELRGYTEHSTAFLNKVTKRDVPDYYNIIKVPMDLGTLMKNLKNIQYKSKAEFAKDVMLIWENCLTYNADAAHPLRKHAFAMRRKSEQLLAMVPDVVIRDRAEVEAEEFGLLDADQYDDDDEEETPLMAGKSTRGTFGPKSTKAKKSKSTKVKVEDADINGHVNGKIEDNVHDGSQSPERLAQAQKTTADNKGEETQDTEQTTTQNGGDVEVVEETDAAFQVWRTRTKMTRARYAGARQKRNKADSLRPDEPALCINPFSLVVMPSSSSVTAKRMLENVHDLDASAQAFQSIGSTDELLLREYEACSMPRVITTSDEIPATDNSFLVQDTLPFEATIGGISEKMRATTLEMKNIRRLCTKLSTLKLMQDPTMAAFPASYFRQLMEADTPLKFQAIELQQAGFDVQPCGEELAHALMQRTSAQVLYHAGFEDFQPQALEAFTEIAGDFLKTIGKVMKDYTESQQQFSEEEIVRHSLFEVGVEDLNVLEDYVTEEIDSRGEKVVALHDRLKKFLNDFIQGTVDGEHGDKNLFDENNQDAFVSGSFGEETGEDFFGFRELGLDKEFGLSSLSVPLRLLQGRLGPVGGLNSTTDPDALNTVRFDRKFPHITKDVAARQIALFQPFLQSKFLLLDEEETESPYLVEDEDLPMRQKKPKPRLGPTGKITTAMKRPIKDPTNVSPKKKKKLEREGTAMSPTATFSKSIA